MPHDSSSNAPNTAKTSAKPAGPSSETEFLARQAADAKAAITHTLSQLQRELFQTADPRAWMKVHPWTTLGMAAVAGFAAAAAAVPSEEEQALHRLAKLEAALGVNRNGHGASPHSESPQPAQKQPSLLAKLAGLAMQAAQPVLMSAIAGITAKNTAHNEPASENVDPPQAPSSDPSI